jgi:hypothetical protein
MMVGIGTLGLTFWLIIRYMDEKRSARESQRFLQDEIGRLERALEKESKTAQKEIATLKTTVEKTATMARLTRQSSPAKTSGPLFPPAPRNPVSFEGWTQGVPPALIPSEESGAPVFPTPSNGFSPSEVINPHPSPEPVETPSDENHSVRTYEPPMLERYAGTSPNRESITTVPWDQSPALAASRDRIALNALALYETSPEETLKFLQDLVTSPSAPTRASSVRALERLESDETFSLLVGLLDDAEPAIKREALKSVKTLVLHAKNPEVKKQAASTLRRELEKGDWIV